MSKYTYRKFKQKRSNTWAILLGIFIPLLIISGFLVYNNVIKALFKSNNVKTQVEVSYPSPPTAPRIDPRALKEIQQDTPTVTVDNWKIDLNNISWKGSTLEVNITITNLSYRRNFGKIGWPYVGPDLVVVDSTNKVFEATVPPPYINKDEGEMGYYLPAYTGEYYPNQSRAGPLEYQVSPYSGTCTLCLKPCDGCRLINLFNLGGPK